MPTIKEVDLEKLAPSHPDLQELILIIAEGDPLVVAEGTSNGSKYAIVTSHTGRNFKFTKTNEGYDLVVSDKK